MARQYTNQNQENAPFWREVAYTMNDHLWLFGDGGVGGYLKDNFPEAPVTETSAGHFLQEEVSTEIAEALVRVINKVTNK